MKLDAMSQIFLSILGLALFTWVAKYFFVLYYYRKKKEEINRLEARVAVLRMLLKAKLKRKGSQMQDQYKDEKEFYASMVSKLDLLTTFNFNRSSDFDDALDILVSISEAIDLHTAQKNPEIYLAQQQQIVQDREAAKTDASAANKSTDAKPTYDRWQQLLKYDKGNLFIVKEIIESTEDLKAKIEVYNSEQDNKELHLRVPELITIDSFEGLRAIVDREQEKAKAGKEAKKLNKQKSLQQDPELAEIEAATAGKKLPPSSSNNGEAA